MELNWVAHCVVGLAMRKLGAVRTAGAVDVFSARRDAPFRNMVLSKTMVDRVAQIIRRVRCKKDWTRSWEWSDEQSFPRPAARSCGDSYIQQAAAGKRWNDVTTRACAFPGP